MLELPGMPWDGRELVEQHHRSAGGSLLWQLTVLIVTLLSTLLWIALTLGLISVSHNPLWRGLSRGSWLSRDPADDKISVRRAAFPCGAAAA